MTDEDKEVSRRVLRQALFWGHYMDNPYTDDDDEVRRALLKALLSIVGGADGLWAARQLLARTDG